MRNKKATNDSEPATPVPREPPALTGRGQAESATAPAPQDTSAPEAEPLVPVEPAPLSTEEIEDLKERAAKADENWDRLLRTTADFDNFKKRAAREKQEAIK